MTAPQTPLRPAGAAPTGGARPHTLGSLCTGYGGLDSAVAAVLPVRLAWVADPDPGAAALLAHHHPDVPNLGDITETDWTQVEPVDVLTAGFPCQDLSYAGRGAGIREGTAKGGQGLSPAFVEWLMGLPAGHVTAVPGLTRNQQLKLLGNGVVPQQGAAALAELLDRSDLAVA